MEENAALERRLSELPEDLNLHILSCYIDQLSDREVIPLSLLSKQVHRIVQNNRPSLVINFCRKRYDDELNYTHFTRQIQNIQLKTFCLIGTVSRWVETGVYDRYIELATKKCLRNLNLKMDYMDYVLPQSVFQLESLVELSLDSCCLKPEIIVGWPNLKRLSIGQEVVGTLQVFENIIRGCPSIEYLNFNSDSFTIDRKFTVANLGNLKQLYFGLGRYCHGLEVNAASNLESIQITDYKFNVIDFGWNEYPRLTSIEVTSRGLDEKFFINFAHWFPMLEKLYIYKSTVLRKINLSCVSLKEIKLIDNRALEEVILDVPKLVHFEFKNKNIAQYKLTPRLTFVGNLGKWSSCIDLRDSYIDASWFLEFNEFLTSLKGSETSVTVEVWQAVFDPVIAHLIPVRGIMEFTLDVSARAIVSRARASAILDCIFSICHPQTITFPDSDVLVTNILQEKLVSTSSHHYHGVTAFHVSQRYVREPNTWRKMKMTSFHLEYSFEIETFTNLF